MNSRLGESTFRRTLLIVLAVGTLLRFYHLGTPCQWMDEILASLNSSHPLAYILELCRRIEVHPPLFYWTIKSVMLASGDDFALRLPAALSGTVTIYLAYLLGKDLWDDQAGLYSAVFVALNPHHLYLSRFVRPYALVVMLFCISLLLTRRAARAGDRRSFLWLMAVDCLMLLLHDLAVLPIASQMVYLVFSRPQGRTGPAWRGLFWVAACTGACLGLEWWFFLRGSSVAGEFFAHRTGLGEAFRTVGDCFARNLYYFEVPWAWVLTGAAFLAGLFVMWRGRRRSALFLALFALLPPIILAATGMTWNLWPRHLCWVIPLAAVAWGVLAASVRISPRGHALAAAVLCIGGASAYLFPAHSRFYEADSYRDKVIGTNYAMLAGRVQAMAGPDDPIVVTHDYLLNGINWYADRLGGANRFRSQEVREDEPRLKLRVLADLHYSYFAANRQDFIDRHHPSDDSALEDNTHLFTLGVERSPVFDVGPVPCVVSVPMDLEGFYSRVGALKDAVFARDARGPFMEATRNDSPGEVEYVFRNGSREPVSLVLLNVSYRNSGRGNSLVAETAFDAEPATSHPLSTGPDVRSCASLALTRDKPFTTLRVRIRMTCAPLTPLFPGGNYATLRFEGLDAAFSGSASEAAMQDEMRRRREDNALDNFLDQRFLTKSTVVQNMVSGDPGLHSVADDEIPGWSRLETAPEHNGGVFVSRIRPGHEHLLVYPRVGSDSSVGFFQLGPDGRREELLELKGREGHWTPISAQYQLALDPSLKVDGEYRVEIRIAGRWAQVWNKNGTLFFAR